MATLGRAILLIGLAISVYGVLASVYGARRQRPDWVASGRRAVYALAALMVLAFVLLEIAFVRSDFSFTVVAQTSATTIPLFYKMAAVWSSQQGSLLLWVMLLSVWSSLVLFLTRRRMRQIAPWATAVLLGFATFFGSLAAFAANPFSTFANGAAPAQGAGLDPLLMHPSMMIHPPMLYSGYTLLAIPFAFAIGALITGRLGSEWIRDTRRFALAAWLFLGIGIVLGARWSYTELGWGGYWEWDAVENAALMPWLVTTAFIHSAQIQEKRGMLKVWNVSLVLLAGVMSIFGTFLVRSGVLSSIHAFGASTLGIPFVALLGVMFFSAIGLVLYRRDSLRSENRLDSLLSREAIFLLQNLVLVALVFVIFWITMFPLISQALTGTKISVGPSAFTPFVVPLAIVLVLLTAVGPLISWRRVTAKNLRRNFICPVAFGMLVTILVVALTGAGRNPEAVAIFGLGAFVMGTVVQEIYRGTVARRAVTRDAWPVALGGLFRRNRRRYGGYTAHFGFAVLLIGIAASSTFQHSRNVWLTPGHGATVGGYHFQYTHPTATATPEKVSFGAQLVVSKRGRYVTTLDTRRGFYPSTNTGDGIVGRFFDGTNADSTVGLDAGALRDIWAVVNARPSAAMTKEIDRANHVFAQDLNPRTGQPIGMSVNTFFGLRDSTVGKIVSQYVTHPFRVQFLFIISPLVTWFWVGALIIALGGLIALWPPTRWRRRPGQLVRQLPGPAHASEDPAREQPARELV